MPVQTTATTSYVVNIGAFGIVGSFQGLSVELMVLGAMAGVAAIALQKSIGRMHALGSVLVSMFLAGSLTPVMAHALESNINFNHQATEGALAVMLGLAWPWMAPVIGTILKDITQAVSDKVKRLLGATKDGS